MKKILLSTIVLLSFSLSILLFQISCKKEAKAESPVTNTGLNILVFQKNAGGKSEIWTANYDGSNQKKVNIQLPTGVTLDGSTTILSPDGKTIFFHTTGIPNANLDGIDIYSCSIDGSNVKKVISHGDTYDVSLEDAK